jgi:hypothetical protein
MLQALSRLYLVIPAQKVRIGRIEQFDHEKAIFMDEQRRGARERAG